MPASTIEYAINMGQATLQMILKYQKRVRSAIYPTIITRPDAAKTINKLLEFSTNPSSEHLAAMNHVI
jgi:hypothetical protein